MTKIFTFPNDTAIEASDAEEAIQRLNDREENEENYTAADAKVEEKKDFFELDAEFHVISHLKTGSGHEHLLDSTGDDYKIVQAAQENTVWSVVDGDNGLPYIIAGFHYVNLIGFMLTKKPWVTGQEEYLW